MTTVPDDPNDVGQAEPPAKRRRGGRRTMNPDISAEDRKRLRILKNRESAMRSLAKKAEYSARLEAKEKEVVQECKLKREALEKLLTTAVGMRAALDKVPDDIAKLISEAETCINRVTTILADDDILHADSNEQNAVETTSQLEASGEGKQQ